MKNFKMNPVGKVVIDERGTFLELEAKYKPCLQALDGFSHINVLWWFSDSEEQGVSDNLEMKQPYKGAPAVMGVFATRGPVRPNPIALTAVSVIDVDHQNGRIQISYIDAYDQTPVLDIKPYTPSFDRIEAPNVPQWCVHWPKSSEESATFDWEKEFNF